MNPSLITLVFEMANFVALAAVLAWLFFKPVRKAIEDQRLQARQQAEEARQTLAVAQRERQTIESQRLALAAELEQLQAKSRDVARLEAEQLVADARAQIEVERAALKREALYIEGAQTTRIARAVATATREALARFLQQLEGPELEQALIRAACRELETFSHKSLAPVTVESALRINDELLKLIKRSLGSAARTANFRVVPELGGGLRISTAHGLIDASITGLANFAEHSLSSTIEAMMREECQGA